MKKDKSQTQVFPSNSIVCLSTESTGVCCVRGRALGGSANKPPWDDQDVCLIFIIFSSTYQPS